MISTDKLTHTLKLKKKIKETERTYSFVFEIPQDLKEKFEHKAGQFVTLFVKPKQEEVRRSYSLSSCPGWDEDFKITVKRVADGLVSNWLIDHVNEGDSLQVTPPAGLFCLPKTDPDHLAFFAGGSGITPILSLIKGALITKPSSKVFLLYTCSDEHSVIFQNELAEIKKKCPDKFNYQISISSKEGRLHSTDIKEFWDKNECAIDSQCYLCGPEGLMATVQASLELQGVTRENIHRESFIATTSHSTYIDEIGDDAIYIGDKSTAGEPVTVEAELDGEVLTVDAQEGISILESLLEAGHNPPYSCMDGACMACMGKVQEGLVYQDDMGILTEDNTTVGECLTCQAKPASKKVKVSYEL